MERMENIFPCCESNRGFLYANKSRLQLHQYNRLPKTFKRGGADETRTRDLLRDREAL
jgi:hypothetical protein